MEGAADGSDESDNDDDDSHARVNGLGLVPPSFQGKPPSPSGLYSSDVLMQVLDLHTRLAEETFAEATTGASNDVTSSDKDGASFRSLHDLIVQATTGSVDSVSSAPAQAPMNVLSPGIQKRLQQTVMIATDVDGTLLTSAAGIHPRTGQALRRALKAAHDPIHPLRHLCLATGKTRTGALQSLRRADPELGRMLEDVPGVFVQGLYCVDGRTGRVLYDQRLEKSATLAADQLAIEDPTVRATSTLFCYRCDDIYYTPQWSQPHHVQELHDLWGEPKPVAVESIEALLLQNSDDAIDDRRCHKLLIMDSDPRRLAASLRPAAETIAKRHGCVVTQAIPTMIELLPPHASKAVGVRRLCESLGILAKANDATVDGLVAIGDAENDVEMLQMASVGFAVGNAVPEAQGAADVNLVETNNEGGAGAAIELVLEHLEPTTNSGLFIIS
jgi:hydroxymethylpyrimidine pyrophosphatase-like HAD family hydrolase